MSNASDFVIKENELQNYTGTSAVVEIPEGVEKIGWGAFRNRTDVTEVMIPEGVTDISGYAFEGCKELKKVTIPQSVKFIGSDAFSATACYRDSANWKKNVFYLGKALIKARPSLSGKCIIEEGTRLIADNAFLQCEKLMGVDIPAGVTHIGSNAFCGCSALAELVLPETVEFIGGGAFSSCASLTSVRIPGSVKDFGKNTFDHCVSLTEAAFSEGASTVGDAMFSSCIMLRRVLLPASMREIIRNAFEYCGNLTEICVDKDNERFFTANGALILRNSKELYLAPRGIKGHYEIPNGVNSIGEEAFGGEHLGAGCSGLADVTIPETVTQIETNAFRFCDGLTSVTIPGSVVRIGEGAFSLCRNLSNVTLQEGVREIDGSAFYRCGKLKEITIPASVEHIHNQAFSDCPEIESFAVSPDHKTLQRKNGMVFNRDGSRLLFCPEKFAGTCRIPDGVKEIDVSAFENCHELTELVLPRGINSLPNRVFYGCERLRKATVYNDYPGDNIGRLFGSYSIDSRDYRRPGCLVTIRDANSDTVCFEVLLACNVNGVGYYEWGKNASFDFKKLDSLFDSYTEMRERLQTAYLRLKYPIDLDDTIKDKYQKFIKRNGVKLFPKILAESQTDMARDFLELGAVSKAKIDSLIEQATALKNPEITTMLMEYKSKHHGTSKPSFDLSDKANKIWESKKDRPELVWRYNGTDRELTLPTELNGKAIIGVDDTVLKKPENYQSIERLVIPEGYRSIGKDAFSGCRNLKEVIFPSTLETLGENCFFGCVSLKRITLPNSLKTWGPASFANCRSLEEVRLPERLSRIPDQSFLQCEKLRSIDFPERLVYIGTEAFRYCISLKEIDLGENVAYLGNRCFYMTRLETVIIRGKKCDAGDSPCFEYPRYVYTDGEIQAIGLPQASRMPLSYLGLKNEQLVKDAGNTYLNGFSVCSLGQLKAFPKINDYRYSNMEFSEFVTKLGGSYSGKLTKTTNVLVTFQVDPENTTIQRAIKQGTAIMTELDFLKMIQAKKPIDLSPWVFTNKETDATEHSNDDPFRPALMKKIWKYTELADGTICLDSYLGKETDVMIPARIGDKPVSVIGENAFSPEGQHVSNRAGKRAVSSVTIPIGVKTVEKSAFEGCVGLESVIIPEGVMTIGDYAFQSCSRLREVRIPDGVANIGDNTFKYCTHLEKVTLPDSVNCIGEYAFSRCNNLTELIIPASVKRIGDGAFYGCDKLADRAGYVIIRQVLYSYCGTERDIVIPEGVVRISTEAFFFCSLRTVTIPSSVTEIGNLAFMSWPDLSIHAPEGSCAEQYAKEKNISFVAE